MILIVIFTAPVSAQQVSVDVKPILLNPNEPSQIHIGDLIYRGGLVLSATDKNFGGFSALQISPDRHQLLSISDRGDEFRAKLMYAKNGNLVGLTGAKLVPLTGIDGQPLQSKKMADAEALATMPTGEFIVSFERKHRFLRYLPGQRKPLLLEAPSGLKKLSKNSGVEALTFLNDGRLLALSEGRDKASRAKGWLRDASGWSSLRYRLSDGFRPTGAATHPNGDVYVLERFYSLLQGVAVRIGRLNEGEIKAGAELRAIPVAEIRPPLNLDNFEGIDIALTPDGKTFVYLISDDNFSILQATLLMMFEVKSK